VFTAIEPPEAVRHRVLDQHTGMSGAVWETQPHITLSHFGELDPTQVERLQAKLRALRFDRFRVSLKEVGIFGDAAAPSVVWIGLESNPNLNALAEELAKVRASLVSTPDRHEFIPHMTLARTSSVEPDEVNDFIETFDTERIGSFSVTGFSLLESVDFRYRTVETFSASNTG